MLLSFARVSVDKEAKTAEFWDIVIGSGLSLKAHSLTHQNQDDQATISQQHWANRVYCEKCKAQGAANSNREDLW